MKFKFCLLALLWIVSASGQAVKSPSNEITTDLRLDASGNSFYAVLYKNKPVMNQSFIGFELENILTMDQEVTSKAEFKLKIAEGVNIITISFESLN